MRLGAQLYTARGLCTTLEGLDDTLKKVADIGYTSVQLSGVCPYEPEWIAEKTKAYGLTADITHFNYDRIMNETDEVIRIHDAMNCKYIGIGSNPNGATPEGLEKLKNDMFPAMKKIAESGHYFMYHNHNPEFARYNGKTYMEMLCEAFPKEICGITLDCYWAMAGGADPVQWLGILRGRVPCIHMKDMVYWPEDKAVRFVSVGDGNMNYPAILSAAESAGTEVAYVEIDKCHGIHPLECLRRSYEYLHSLGLN